ncbi:MAG: tellurium resistance protein TerC [Ahrensia sp.]|nr:tellurium resistance protein TerC [Ahrensia sp.]
MDILASLFTIDNLITFMILTALETVLGFDNLLYISLEAKKVGAQHEARVRKIGIILAIGLRIVLLFVVLQLIKFFEAPFYTFNLEGIVEGAVSGHAVIVLLGGVFLMYTAIKEITHMLAVHDVGHEVGTRAMSSVGKALFWILVMNIVFSFDTVLSAVALTDHFIVMVAAIIVSGVLMVVMADTVANFLNKNRMYEVIGLFVLLLVGILLTTEGGHLAHLKFFGYSVEAMSKATFYFVLVTMILVEIVQGRYQRKLMAEKQNSKH